MIVNIIIYEVFARVKLNNQQVYIFIWVLTLFSSFYAILTSNYDKIFFGNRNTVPVLLLLMLFISDLYLHERKITLSLVWIFVIFFTYTCQSRAGLLGVMSYFIFRNIKSKKIQIFLFVGSLALLIFLYVFNYSTLLSFLIMGRSISSLARRDILWSFSFSLIPKYPLGMGYRGYNEIFNSILGVSYSIHNSYLNILLQFGYLFFITYIIFFLKLVRDSNLPITLACIFSIYLRAFFESGIPFGFSLSSAMLLLPFFMEKGFLSSERKQEGKVFHENRREPNVYQIR